jgi:DNA-binding response OmpR family regulator
MQILLVEDEHPVLRALTWALTGKGHHVDAVGSAGAALRHLEARRFDVVIVDINLPDATGWDVLRGMAWGPNAATPSVVMSALPPSVRRLREFSPVRVLLKPFPIDALFHAAEWAATREEIDD